MVRLIPIEVAGRVVWTEDAPTHCPAGHEGLRPIWTVCADCRYGCRHWRCLTCPALVRDDEHVCRA